MNRTVKIEISDDNKTAAPLWEQYQGQCTPQNAFLELYPTSSDDIELSAMYSGDVGNNSTSMDVFNGNAFRFSLRSNVLRSELESLTSNEKFVTLINEFVALYFTDDEEYDEDEDLDRGEKMSMLEDEIDQITESLDCANVWDTKEWLADEWIDTVIEEGSIDKAADEFLRCVEPEDVVFGITDALEELAKAHLEECDDNDEWNEKDRQLERIVEAAEA